MIRKNYTVYNIKTIIIYIPSYIIITLYTQQKMTTFSKFIKQVKTKLVSENLMTEEIKAALASIEQPTKRKLSNYHILMKNILHQVVEEYPNVVHKIRFKMAAQIAGLIHKQNVSQELAWKIIIQRNFTNDDVKNATLVSDKGKKASANEPEKEQQDKASSSGVSTKKRRQNKEDNNNTTTTDIVSAPTLAEVQMEDITHILKDNSEHNKPEETEPTAVVLISDDENEEQNTDTEVEIEKATLNKKKDDTNSLQFLREYVKNKVPTMHVNDRYKIVNKMKRLVNSVTDLTSVDKAYTQIVN